MPVRSLDSGGLEEIRETLPNRTDLHSLQLLHDTQISTASLADRCRECENAACHEMPRIQVSSCQCVKDKPGPQRLTFGRKHTAYLQTRTKR